jgi:hypothetical protein
MVGYNANGSTIPFGGIVAASSISTYGCDDVIQVSHAILNSDISMGSGNDTLSVGHHISLGSEVDMGMGDDTIDVGGNVSVCSTIDTGMGNDTITIDGSIKGHSTLDTGEGDDVVNVGNVGSHFTSATIELGDGDDTLTIDGNYYSHSQIDGGDGSNDILNLTGNCRTTLDLEHVTGFENINLNGHDTVNLSLADVLANTETNDLVISGTDSDQVNMSGDWTTSSSNMSGYDLYFSTSTAECVFIDTDVQVNII